MEAIRETDSFVPEYIIAFPTSVQDLLDPRAKGIFGIGIPGGGSWLASGGDPQATIRGIEAFEGPQPPVALIFWSFRTMVALGFWFILLAVWGAYRWWRGELLEDDLLHKTLMASTPLGILAVHVGWIVTEVGRQLWIIQDVMKTSEGVSSNLSGTEATMTLVGFVLVSLVLLVLYLYVVARIIRAGLPSVSASTTTVSSSDSSAEATVDD